MNNNRTYLTNACIAYVLGKKDVEDLSKMDRFDITKEVSNKFGTPFGFIPVVGQNYFYAQNGILIKCAVKEFTNGRYYLDEAIAEGVNILGSHANLIDIVDNVFLVDPVARNSYFKNINEFREHQVTLITKHSNLDRSDRERFRMFLRKKYIQTIARKEKDKDYFLFNDMLEYAKAVKL